MVDTLEDLFGDIDDSEPERYIFYPYYDRLKTSMVLTVLLFYSTSQVSPESFPKYLPPRSERL